MAEGTQVTSLSLNTAGEFSGDVSVRQALSWATDNTRFFRDGLRRSAEPASSYFADSISLAPETGADRYNYQPEKAVWLLEEAGWKLEEGRDYRQRMGPNWKLICSMTRYLKTENDWSGSPGTV